jgi:hypothetical protein
LRIGNKQKQSGDCGIKKRGKYLQPSRPEFAIRIKNKTFRPRKRHQN